MSLLDDIHAALEKESALTIVGIDYKHVGNRFNTIRFRLTPSAPVDEAELRVYFAQLKLLFHQQQLRVYDFSDDSFGPNIYGTIVYEEKIGTEEVVRTFTVDDAVSHGGRIFEIGRHEPEERDLVRAIEVTLYSTIKRALRSKSGLTIYELERESLQDIARDLGVTVPGERTGS